MRRLYQTAVAATSLLLPSESPVLRAPTLRPDPQALPRLLDGRPVRPGRHPLMRPLNPGCCRSARLAAKLSTGDRCRSRCDGPPKPGLTDTGISAAYRMS